MSNNAECIPLSNSPITSGSYRDGRNNRQYFNRGFNQNPGPRFNGIRNNCSPYNRGYGQRSFNAPRFEKNHDISIYYHPSMMQNPWEQLEYLLKKPTQPSLADDLHETTSNSKTSNSTFDKSKASIS